MFEMTVRIGSPSEIFANNAIIPTDIWSVGKESIAMFELATWQASSLIFSSSSDAIPLLGNKNYCFQTTETGFAE
jgi:hypothetical protein